MVKMDRRVFIKLGLTAVTIPFISQSALSSVQGETKKHVVLIVWDGTNRDILYTLIDRYNKLPNLQKVIWPGGLYDFQIGKDNNFKSTVTKPCHATMLTSKTADETLVYGNKPAYYDPTFRREIEWQPIPDGLTIYDILKNRLSDVYTSHIASKKHLLLSNGSDPMVFYNSRDSLDYEKVWTKQGWTTMAKVTSKAIEAYRQAKQHNSSFTFIHYAQPDKTGHNSGCWLKWKRKRRRRRALWRMAYWKAIIKVDKQLGILLNEFSEDTIILITTDHGFGYSSTGYSDPYGHKRCPEIWLATNKTLTLEGHDLRDITSTILKIYGLTL